MDSEKFSKNRWVFFKRLESFLVEPMPEGTLAPGNGRFLDGVFEGSFADAITRASQLSSNLRLLAAIVASPE